MSEAMSPVPETHPLMKAWTAWKQTESYRAARTTGHIEDSLWVAFMAGFNASHTTESDIAELEAKASPIVDLSHTIDFADGLDELETK